MKSDSTLAWAVILVFLYAAFYPTHFGSWLGGIYRAFSIAASGTP